MSLGLMACPDKKTETPPKPAEVKPVVVAPPPAVVEPRADKECAAPIDPGPVTELKFG
jgi:hypothetical protein